MNQQYTYRLTTKGRSLRTQGGNVPAPLEYANILGVLDHTVDPVAIRSYLTGYLAHLVEGWLVHFEAEGLIERIPVAQSRPTEPMPILEGEALERETVFADTSLTGIGVYISQQRLARRQPSHKAVGDTVAMVLEDDPDQLALAKLRLATAGYRVVGAETVKTFHEALQNITPDAAFLDVNLPDGDGFEVLAGLRKDPAYAELPIIMVTVRSEPADIAKGLTLGADGYVTKPYGRNTLEYVLSFVMKREVTTASATA